MRVKIAIEILIVSFLMFNCAFSQYYTPVQIQNIHQTKTAAEGDMYLDTVNKKFYEGLTNGELARIGDTLDELIDSVTYLNDTLTIYEGNSIFKLPIKASARSGIDSIRIDNDTLKIFDSTSVFTAEIKQNNAVPLWKADSLGVTYNALDIINYAGNLYRNKTGINADSVPNVDTANWTQITGVTYTGWADYTDTEYTSANPFIVETTKVSLPNNAGSTVDFQKPMDIPTFYNSADSTITGRNGDAINIVIEFRARPNTNIVTRITTAIDIGGSVGEIYPRDFILSKGNNVEHFYLSSFNAYTLGTFEANGGKIKITATESTDIYNIRYVISRVHKAK